MNINPITPHGKGFSFIDTFTIVEPGKKIHATKWLDPALPFFADHFPGEPIMPGVLLIEAAAQTAGGIWKSHHHTEKPIRYLLAQVNQFKITRSVFPGQTLEIVVELIKDLGMLAQFSAILKEGGKIVAQGNIVLSQKTTRD